MNSQRPKLLAYSLLLPVIWLALGATLDALPIDLQLGMSGLLLIVYLTLSVICWRIARVHQRPLTRGEKLRLSAYFVLWNLMCESLALYSVLPGVEPAVLLMTLGITLIVDSVVLSLAVHFLTGRLIGFFLKRTSVSATSTPSA